LPATPGRATLRSAAGGEARQTAPAEVLGLEDTPGEVHRVGTDNAI
jgi:hypothetical protein